MQQRIKWPVKPKVNYCLSFNRESLPTLVYKAFFLCCWDSSDPPPKRQKAAKCTMPFRALQHHCLLPSTSCPVLSPWTFPLLCIPCLWPYFPPYLDAMHIPQPHAICLKICYSQFTIKYHLPYELTLASNTTPKTGLQLFLLLFLLLKFEFWVQNNINNS